MCATANALRQADELCAQLKPHLAEMIERSDLSVVALTFSDIEANAAAVGDSLAKLMMLQALADGLGLGRVRVRMDRRAGEARADALDQDGGGARPRDQGRHDVRGRPLGTQMARPHPDPRNNRSRPRS